MSLDPDLTCPYCGSYNLFEDIYYDEDGTKDVDVFCNLCNRRVL